MRTRRSYHLSWGSPLSRCHWQSASGQCGRLTSLFVARLGSYQEVSLDVITGADKVVVDNWHYVRPRIPELTVLAGEGRFGFERIHAEWPDIVAGRRPGRESPDEVIVYIALGIWGEYAAILPEVYRRALSLGLGRRLTAPLGN
jgi:ornithine cyclodeaminase/alanine dehydrogenase-like protein (mu-crystallin family)